MVKEDKDSIKKRMWKVKLQKALPRWSFAIAIWRTLMFPNRTSKGKRQGIGYEDETFSNPLFHRFLFWLCAAIRAHAKVPNQWNISSAFTIPKPSGMDLKGLRVLHSLDGMGKADFSCMWHNSGIDRIAHRRNIQVHMPSIVPENWQSYHKHCWPVDSPSPTFPMHKIHLIQRMRLPLFPLPCSAVLFLHLHIANMPPQS